MNLPLRIANYINRYAPSEKKLIEYISKKNPTFPTIEFLPEIGYSEDMMCDMWMRTFLSRSTPEREIHMKLLKKGFPKKLIETKIESSSPEIRDWETHGREIESKIESLIKKGKSTQIIRMMLSGKYPYFRDEISEILSGTSDSPGLRKEVERYKKKYTLSNTHDRQKFYAALQRKGFHYDDIRTLLRKEAEESQ